MTRWTNPEWLERLRGEGPAADEAARELRRILRGSLKKSIGFRPGVDDERIDDFVQDACLQIMTSLERFRGDSQFTTWAIAIAIRVSFSEMRRARWRDVSLDHLTESAGTDTLADSAAESPENAPISAEDSETRRVILSELQDVIARELTDRQRFLISGELSGVPQAELCARLGINRNALHKLGHDARQKLKKRLIERGISVEEIRGAFSLADGS